MVFPVYSIRDNKTQFFEPQLHNNEQAAVRAFDMAVHNTGSVTAFSPSDFDLFQIGDYDTDTGIFNPVTPIKFVTNGGSLV